jgi:beta-glucosidase
MKFSLLLLASIFVSTAGFASDSSFWWGISTSPYQTEDPGATGSFKTDWDLFFESGKIKEPRGNGAYSYTQVDRDIRALKSLGVTHYRFGVEWARVEPEPGHFNEAAINHYVQLAHELNKQGIIPIVCLWHFTFPYWLANQTQPEQSGWLNPKTLDAWQRYTEKIVSALGSEVQYYAPENEPNGQALAAYFLGTFPPGKKYSLSLFRASTDASANAFIAAAKIIKSLQPNAKVLTIQNMIVWEKASWDVFGYFMKLGDEYNYRHLDAVAPFTDFIGFNYYYKVKASPFPNPRITYPEGLSEFIETLSKRYKKPIIVTENGTADSGDSVRQAYLRDHLASLEKARENAKRAGYEIKGYFYWSLIDNFEWAYGYSEKFGLFSVGSSPDQLIEKPSANIFRRAIQESQAAPK